MTKSRSDAIRKEAKRLRRTLRRRMLKCNHQERFQHPSGRVEWLPGERVVEFAIDVIGRPWKRTYCVYCSAILESEKMADPECGHRERQRVWRYRAPYTGAEITRWRCVLCQYRWTTQEPADLDGTEGKQARADSLEEWLELVERGMERE